MQNPSLTPAPNQSIVSTQLKSLIDGQDIGDATAIDQSILYWKISNLDLTVTGQTIIIPVKNGTTTSGLRFVPTNVVPIIELVSITGALVTPAIITIGNNSATFNNLVTAATLTAFSTLNETWPLSFVANPPGLSLDTLSIKVNVTQAVVGPSVYLVNIYLPGILTN